VKDIRIIDLLWAIRLVAIPGIDSIKRLMSISRSLRKMRSYLCLETRMMYLMLKTKNIYNSAHMFKKD
jgi:hypothetical protein